MVNIRIIIMHIYEIGEGGGLTSGSKQKTLAMQPFTKKLVYYDRDKTITH